MEPSDFDGRSQSDVVDSRSDGRPRDAVPGHFALAGRTRFRPALAALLLVFALEAPAAEGLRSLPTSAESQGMIGGKIALTRDPSVLRLNPATLTDLTGPEIQISPSFWYGQIEFDSVAPGVDETMDSPLKYTGGINFASPFPDGRFTFGLGLNLPIGLDMQWPRHGAFRYVAPHEATLKYIAFNPAVAMKVTDNLSIGAGLEVVWSEIELVQDYPWFLVPGMPAGVPDGRTNYEADGWGMGAYLGINWDPAPGHRISLTARLPVSIDYDGDFSVTNIPPPLTGVFSRKSSFSTEMEFPASIAIAYGVRLTDTIRAGFEFEWIGNSSHDDLPLQIGDNQALLPSDRAILDWDDSYSVGFGVEWKARDDLTLRAGYLFSESPMGNHTFTPVVPADDRHMISVGATWLRDPHVLSLAYVVGLYPDRNVRNNQEPAFNGDYEFHWDVLTFSYGYRF